MSKLIEINWNPTHRQLRQFGVICFFALPLVGWIWNAGLPVVACLAGIGLVLAILSFIVPAAIKPVFLALTILATPIGMVLGEFMMLVIFFGVFWAFGMIFRLMGRDALELKIDKHRNTYWHPKKQPRDLASYYRQS